MQVFRCRSRKILKSISEINKKTAILFSVTINEPKLDFNAPLRTTGDECCGGKISYFS